VALALALALALASAANILDRQGFIRHTALII